MKRIFNNIINGAYLFNLQINSFLNFPRNFHGTSRIDVNARTKERVNCFSEMLSDKLLLTKSKSLELISNNPLLIKLDPIKFEKNITYLANHFNKDDLIKNIRIITMNTTSLKQRHQILKEIGFWTISVKNILEFDFTFNCNETTLYNKGYLQTVNSMKPLMDIYQGPEEVKQNFVQEKIYQRNYKEAYVILNTEYLLAVLQLESEFFIEHPFVSYQSLVFLPKILDILRDNFNMDINLLRKHGELLYKQVPDELENIHLKGTIDMYLKSLVHNNPRLLVNNLETIEMKMETLKNYGVKERDISAFNSVIHLKPDKLKNYFNRRNFNIKPDLKLKKTESYEERLRNYPGWEKSKLVDENLFNYLRSKKLSHRQIYLGIEVIYENKEQLETIIDTFLGLDDEKCTKLFNYTAKYWITNPFFLHLIGFIAIKNIFKI